VRLPGAERAVVDPAKVRDYLLALDHPVGRGKAQFFHGLGFTRSAWPALHRILLQVPEYADASELPRSPYGQKYAAPAIIEGPNGRSAEVMTIWIVSDGEGFPRFVTAYPGDAR
jgi:hypothetical protein